MTRTATAVLALGISSATGVFASDLEKEARWAGQIVDFLMDGDAVYLDDGRSEFLALETPAADGALTRAAVIMHGTGVHPNWSTVVLPLRVGLPENGWHTLSIQMPVLPNEAEDADYPAIYDGVPGRIDAAIDYLTGQGAETIVLIAHSQGATMTAYYLAETGREVDGFVAIGMGPGISGTAADNLAHLPKVSAPLLDLYGSEDLPQVLQSSAARSAAATGTPAFRQRVVDGADHFFDGEEEDLLRSMRDWLDEL
jgi:pimeloyl-ACP methyl ester carboxylesterase